MQKQLKNKSLFENKKLWLKGCAAGLLVIVFSVGIIFIPIKTTKNFGPLPDFSSFNDVSEMKTAFYHYLTPIIEHHNALIQQERNQLISLQKNYNTEQKLNTKDKKLLTRIAKKYQYNLADDWHKKPKSPTQSNATTINQIISHLLLRVDQIPLSLALVQASKESGWGRSRFAVQANNLFGQWCYKKGCGLVPAKRAKNANHEVAKFAHPSAAIASYMNNLNTHKRYSLLRTIRADLRAQGKPISAHLLASGLLYYSQRREAYVADIKAMLKDYKKFKTQQINIKSTTENKTENTTKDNL